MAMQDSEAIRNAVLRYQVSHPVVNDTNMVLWRDLGVASWPTLMVVSPKGRVIATLAGACSHLLSRLSDLCCNGGEAGPALPLAKRWGLQVMRHAVEERLFA